MLTISRWAAWVLSSLVVLALVAQPVSVEAQLSLALGVIVSMTLFWVFGRGPWVRQILLGLGSLVVLRYVYWRTTQTLPSISDPVNFIPGVILYAAEMYCFVILTISLVINVDPLRRAPLKRGDDEALPTVDVFIPTYNEDEYILATTIAAARSMDYPEHKLKVWLCDDGGTDQKCADPNPEKAAAARARRESLQKLCAELGAHYHTRAKNEHAKAGNMNACLKDSDGELIVVFDADHAPFRMFLRETVGHFIEDRKVFLVQTPHVFLNPDPIEKNLKTFDRMPSENEMFYSVTQRGLDKWDGSFFCGSAAVLRREALLETDGFSGITITEDCETAFELHSRGWRSVYVDKPLIAGLQPETFTSFIGQRSRWCQGMFQIMILKNPAMKKGLSFIQRVAYLSSMTFWFFPVPRLIFMFAPLLYIFFDVKLFVANVQETIAYTAMYLVVNVMIQNYIYGRVRWPWVSELYEYVQGVFLLKAIVTVVANPRKPTFNVTSKGLTLDNDHLSELAWPFFAIYGLLFAGGIVALLRYAFEPGVNALMLVVGLWNIFNMIIAGAALGAVAERKQPDRHPRLKIARTGRLEIDGAVHAVRVVDVSAGGCAVTLDAGDELNDLEAGASATLIVDAVGEHAGDARLPLRVSRVAQGAERATIGFEFPELQAVQYFALADLMYGDSDALPRFLESRRTHKDLWRGTAQFVHWGLFEPLRSFSYAAMALRGAKTDDKAQAALPAPVADTVVKPVAKLAPVAKPAPSQAAQIAAAPDRLAPAAWSAEAAARPPLSAAAMTRDLAEAAASKAESAPALALRDPLAELVAALSPEAGPQAPATQTPAVSSEDTVDSLRRLLDGAHRARRSAA